MSLHLHHAALALLAATPAITAHVDVDVLIVGAGQAGMAAAHRLASQGYSVRVVEATDHVGGRTRNFDLALRSFDHASDDALEVGGTWLSPHHTAALELCQELGIEVYNSSMVDAQGTAGDGSHGGEEEDWPWWFWGSDYPKEQTSRLRATVYHGSSGTFRFRSPADLASQFDLHLSLDLQRAATRIQEAATSAGAACWNTTVVADAWRELDLTSTAGALFGSLGSTEAQQILRNAIHNKNAQEPESVSFLYNALSFRGCNSHGPDEQFRVRGGTQALPLAISRRLGGNVSLSSPVVGIQALSDGVKAELEGGQALAARALVLTGPPPAILGIRLQPQLGAAEAQLLQRMPMGTSLKYAAVYREGPWWWDLGLQGTILASHLPERFSLPDGVIPLFVQCVDHSPFSRRLGVIVCFMEGRQNLHFTSLSKDRQRAAFLSFLSWSFNDTRAETLQPEIVSHNWADEAFARGAYTNYFPPGVLSTPEYWQAYRTLEKLPNVFLAGSDYHAGFGNGFIEGAVRSGLDAANLVHDRIQAGQVDVHSLVV